MQDHGDLVDKVIRKLLKSGVHSNIKIINKNTDTIIWNDNINVSLPDELLNKRIHNWGYDYSGILIYVMD